MCEYEAEGVVLEVEHDGVGLLVREIVFVYEYAELADPESVVEFVVYDSEFEVVGCGEDVELVALHIDVEFVGCEEVVGLVG